MSKLPYLTPVILKSAESGVIELVVSKAPSYAWLNTVETSAVNDWILQGICNEVNSLTGATLVGTMRQ